jgi:signal peptidase I
MKGGPSLGRNKRRRATVDEQREAEAILRAQAASSEDDEKSSGKSLLALSGGLVWPGLGHFLAGSFYLGLFWFTLWIVVLLSGLGIYLYPQYSWGIFVLIPAGFFIQAFQLVDARRVGHHSKLSMLGDPSFRMGTSIGLIMLAFVLQHQAITFLQDNVFEVCYTPTPSMAPILAAGDLFVTFKNEPIKRWDIIGFDKPPGIYTDVDCKNFMKRCVGLPGDTIEITDKGILINGKLAADMPSDAGPYFPTDIGGQRLMRRSPTMAAPGCWGRPITLGPDEYFALGDNTLESMDCRFFPSIAGHQFGALPRDSITCKVVAIMWPTQRWRAFP